MQSFVTRHQPQIQGTLSGFDRLRFVGSLLRLSYVDGLAGFLAGTGVLLKEFGDYMLGLSRRIKQASECKHHLEPEEGQKLIDQIDEIAEIFWTTKKA